MELAFRDGDYVPDGNGGLVKVDGVQALLQRVLWKLTVRRGSFPFLPGLGSSLYLLLREKAGARTALARRYVSEALADESQLALTGVGLSDRADGGCNIQVLLDYQGVPLSLTVSI